MRMIAHGVRSLAVFIMVAAAAGTGCAPAARPASTVPAATAPARVDARTPKSGGIAKVAAYQEPNTLNLLLATQTITTVVAETMVEGLLAADPNGNYIPALAREVPSLENGGVSADGLTVTYKLREGVKWSDGQPFTADDVVFTYQAIMDPSNPIQSRSGYEDMESVTAPDPLTVVAKYKRFFAPFLSRFMSGVHPILPKHVFQGNTANIDKSPYNRAPVGTGPFRFVSWASGDNITLERNPYYREPGKPYLDGLIFKITPSREAAVQTIKTGEVDAIWDLGEALVPEFEKLADVDLEAVPGVAVERLVLNLSSPHGPNAGDPSTQHWALSDGRVRQAIQLGIDKKTIADKLLYGKTMVATSVLSNGWFALRAEPSEFNPARAKELLDQAGWTPGADGIREKDGRRLSLRYGTTSGNKLRELTQQVIQEQMQAIGIELQIQNVPSAVLFGSWDDGAARKRGTFDILMWTSNPDVDPHQHVYGYFHSSQIPSEKNKGGFNYARFQDPETDKAIEEAASTPDQEKRATAYRRMAERVNQELPHIVLYNRLDAQAYRKTLQGHVPNIWDNMTWNVQDWWLNQ